MRIAATVGTDYASLLCFVLLITPLQQFTVFCSLFWSFSRHLCSTPHGKSLHTQPLAAIAALLIAFASASCFDQPVSASFMERQPWRHPRDYFIKVFKFEVLFVTLSSKLPRLSDFVSFLQIYDWKCPIQVFAVGTALNLHFSYLRRMFMKSWAQFFVHLSQSGLKILFPARRKFRSSRDRCATYEKRCINIYKNGTADRRA